MLSGCQYTCWLSVHMLALPADPGIRDLKFKQLSPAERGHQPLRLSGTARWLCLLRESRSRLPEQRVCCPEQTQQLARAAQRRQRTTPADYVHAAQQSGSATITCSATIRQRGSCGKKGTKGGNPGSAKPGSTQSDCTQLSSARSKQDKPRRRANPGSAWHATRQR